MILNKNFTAKSLSLSFLLSFIVTVSLAQNRFWVGGSGNWNDPNRWSLTSGGAPGASVPNATTNAIFDANSFLTAGRVVTLNVNAICNTMDWRGSAFTPTFTGGGQLEVHGSLYFIPAMNVTTTGIINYLGAGTNEIDMQDRTVGGNILFTGAGVFNLLSNLRTNSEIFFRAGTINSNGFTFNVGNFRADQTAICNLNLGSSIVNISGTNNGFFNPNLNFSAGTSILRFFTNGSIFTCSVKGFDFANIEVLANAFITFPTGVFTYGFSDIVIGNNASFISTGNSNKTFLNVTSGTNGSLNIAGTNIFNGNVFFGPITSGAINTRINGTNTFNGTVTLNGPTSDTDRIHFYNSRFNSTLTHNGNGSRAQYRSNCYFAGFVTIQNNTSGTTAWRLYGTDTVAAGAFIGDNTFSEFTNQNAAGSRTVFYGPVTIGNNIGVGNCDANRDIEFYGPVTVGNGTTFQFCENAGQARFRDNLTVGNNAQVRLRRNVWIEGTYTQGTGGNARFSEFSDTSRFDGPVSFSGGHSEVRFHRTAFFNSTLNFGNNANNIVFNENNNNSAGSLATRFLGAVTLGNNCNFNGRRRALFFSTLSTGNDCTLSFNEDNINAAQNHSQFDGNVNIGNNADIRIRRTAFINANFVIGANATCQFNEIGGAINQSGALTTATFRIGATSLVTFNPGAANTIRNFFIGEFTRVTFNNNGILNTFRTFNFGRFNTVFFNTGANGTLFTNGMTGANTCGSWNFIRSNGQNTQARLTFNTATTVDEFIVLDIAVQPGQFLSVNSGVDVSNNSGNITFLAPRTTRTFYWVPGVGGTSNWGDSTNWSTVSGNTSATFSRQCIPTPIDSVVFDNNSFTAARRFVDLNLFLNYCKGMTWTSGVTNNPILRGPQQNTLNIFGELEFQNEAVQSISFEGRTEFGASETDLKRINTRNEDFNGEIVFNSFQGNWIITSTLDVRGANRGNITIERGIVNGSGTTIQLEGNWEVADNTPAPQFIASSSNVVFRGNTSDRTIITRGNDFYNLDIAKSNNARVVRVRNNPITVRNNLTITRGQLSDAGNGFNEGPFQISGNTTGTGTLSISANGTLHIGRSGDWAGGADLGVVGIAGSPGVGATNNTTFPTGWSTADIALDINSTVLYRRHGNQPVSALPQYGILELFNPNGCGAENCRRMRYMDGPLNVFNQLILRNGITLVDSGFQITGGINSQLIMEPNAELQLGNSIGDTQFPIGITDGNINMNVNSTVIYNSSSTTPIQNVRGLTGAGNSSYGNLVIRSANAFRGPGGSPTVSRILTGPIRNKVLLSNTIIRGDLLIENNTNLDVSPSSFEIDIRGNWTATTGARFTSRSGTVNFTDGNAQTIEAPLTNHQMHIITMNKSGNQLTLLSPIIVNSLVNFTSRNINSTQVNYLQLNDNAIVGVGGNAPKNASHVNGWVRKIGDDAFTFPVGNGTVYRPIGISNPTDLNTSFEANYVQAVAPHPVTGAVLPVTVDRISVAEHWNLNRLVAGAGSSSDVRVTLSWQNPTSGGVQTFDSLVVVRWNGSAWIDHGPNIPAVAPGGRTGNNTAGTVTTTSALSSFSPFTLGSRSFIIFNPLPVNLISFSARPTGTKSLLEWQVSQEMGLLHYVIQRSSDGGSFVDMNTITSRGVESLQNYASTDERPIRGNNYYRLKMVNLDGSVDYSSVAVVFHGIGKDLVFSAYPNPTDGSRITFAETAQGLKVQLIQIHNELGQLIAPDQEFTSPREELEVMFSKPLISGVYVATLKAEGTEEPVRVKFIVY